MPHSEIINYFSRKLLGGRITGGRDINLPPEHPQPKPPPQPTLGERLDKSKEAFAEAWKKIEALKAAQKR